MYILIEKEFVDCNKNAEVFEEFSLIYDNITSQKVTEWNNLINVSTETRWVWGSIPTLSSQQSSA